MLSRIRCCASALAVCAAAAAQAQSVERTPLLDSDFPISAAVTVKAETLRVGTDLVFLSGAMGLPPKGSTAAPGDTAAQTTAALTALQATLARMGMTMGDVVKMTVFLVGDPAKDNKMDFAGMMAGYTKFFGTREQPNKPARSAVQVAGLVAPGALVEIEAVAARTH